MPNRVITKGQIGNALESVAPDHILGVANDIFDEELQMYQSEINRSAGVYDISANHLVEGQPSTYTDLEDALGVDGANVPVNIRKGGMSVKFVQSSDNKYVQYRLTADSWSTYAADWERYNDITTSNQPNSDLDIKDDSGNVLVRIAEGHIKMKNFDSRNVGNRIENDEMDEVLGGEIAVYLTDSTGAAVLDDEGKPIEII